MFNKLAPKDKEYWDAYNLSKNKQYTEAVKAYEKYLVTHSWDEQARIGLSWCLFYINGQILKEKITDGSLKDFKRNLNKAICKDFCPKENKLYSVFLNQALMFLNTLRVIKREDQFNFLLFTKYWNIGNLKPEDWEEKSQDGKHYQSLACKVILEICHTALSDDAITQENLLYALDCVCMGSEKVENIWFVYYKAKILFKLGRTRESEEFMLSVIRSKNTESWAWDFLSDILKTNSDQRYFAALCKAVSLVRDETKARKLHLKLAAACLDRGLYAEAKRELITIGEVTNKHGFKPLQEVDCLTKEDWFEGSEASVSNKELYIKFAPDADEIVSGSLPWIDGIVGSQFRNNAGKLRVSIYTKDEYYSVSAHRSDLSGFGRGDPISVRILENLDSKSVYQIKQREGAAWDLLSKGEALIDLVNTNKKCIHILLPNLKNTVIYLTDKEISSVKVGDFISIVYLDSQSERLRVEHWKKSSKVIPELCKTFEETVEFFDNEKNFGFTEEGIFIQRLDCKEKIEEGDIVSGTAIKNFDKKKNRWGWKAISLRKILS